MPEVSVIMNCYNGERYLRAAIDSVLNQTHRDWELIFWDNASTDGSAAVVTSYRDSRIRYFRGEQNVPLGQARGFALEQARGEWIGFLDTDDLWYPHKLARQMSALADTQHVLCYAGVREIHPDGRLIREVLPIHPSGDMLAGQLVQFDINMVTPLVRRAVLEVHGLTFDPTVSASEEYNLFMRLLAKGTGCAVDEVLGCWRVAPGTLTDRSIAIWGRERAYTLDQLERENPGLSARLAVPFAEARARGRYYQARWLMSERRTAEARAELRTAAAVDASYHWLGLLAKVPWLWDLAHSNTIKRRWLPRLRRLLVNR